MTTCAPPIEAGPAEPHPHADPEWLADSPSDIQAVYFYWKAKAGERRMPARADIDPIDLVAYLPSILLVDVLPPLNASDGSVSPHHHFLYRLVGTREVEVRGMDPTGRSVATHAFGHEAGLALKNYETVVREAGPIIDRSEEFSPDHSLADLDAIFLPLSNDAINVNMILVYTHQERFRP